MPGPYTYSGLIPAATDKISESQDKIKTNFASIKSLVDINHEDFASADAGKHIKVDFTSQGAAVTSSGTDITLSNAASGGVQELYISKATGTPYALTQGSANVSGKGWCTLPNGVLMAWYQGSANASTGGTNNTISYAAASPDIAANWPGVTTFYNAQILISTNGVNATATYNSAVASPTLGFTCYSAASPVTVFITILGK